MLDEAGKPVDASFTVEKSSGNLSIVLESRGGRGRNPGYANALRLMLVRLGAMEAVLQRVVVDSQATRTLHEAERLVSPEGYRFPLRLDAVEDYEKLRKAIGKAQEKIGQAKGIRGGCRTRRIRLHIDFPGKSPTAVDVQRIMESPHGSPISAASRNRAR